MLATPTVRARACLDICVKSHACRLKAIGLKSTRMCATVRVSISVSNPLADSTETRSFLEFNSTAAGVLNLITHQTLVKTENERVSWR